MKRSTPWRWPAVLPAALLTVLAGACAGPVPEPDSGTVAETVRETVRDTVAETVPQTPAPYAATVAARFPAPAVRYRTPAFEPGRQAFTGNEELSAALREIAASGAARLLVPGMSQAGLPIEALHFARARGGPTVLIVAQQHGDEPASAEAALAVAHELAAGRLAPLLDRIGVIVLPRANPDASALALRTSAGGIDVNRDHLLLRTPEARALARLMREHRPAVVVDAHEFTVVGRWLDKFGAVQRFDVLTQYATTANLPPALERASDAWFRQPLLAELAREGLSVEWYHTTSTTLDDRRVSMGGVQPDNGRNVAGLKNAVSLLVETRGIGIGRWHFTRRVHAQVVAMRSVLASAAEHADALLALRERLDAEVAAQACRGDVVVLAVPTPQRRELLFIDPVTGADRPIEVDWNSSLERRVLLERARPCGYWLDVSAGADVVPRLRALGLTVQRFDADAVLEVQAWREIARTESVRPDVRGDAGDVGATIVNVAVELEQRRIDAPAGSFYVPLDQPLANLAPAALEPDTPNSYFAHRLLPALDAAARVMAPPDAPRTALR